MDLEDQSVASGRWVPDLRSKFVVEAVSSPSGANAWPKLTELTVAFVLALLVTALDIYFSTQIGLLANPSFYDGIAYMLNAKSLFYSHRFASHNTLWELLMVLSFLLLGEGEWQTYTVRFWPTFLMLLLVLWIARSRGGSHMAWTAVAFTSLLPTISVGLRSSSSEYLSGIMNFSHEWYLADLRADLLFAVLVLWTVVPILERLDTLNRRVWLVSGTFAGLAILVKPSAFTELIFAWGLTIVYVLIANRRHFSATFRKCLLTMVPFAVLLVPWALTGGVVYWWRYVCLNAFGPYRILYSNPQATFLSEFTYYWSLFPFHLGQVESWVMLGIGLSCFFYVMKKNRHVDKSMVGYLALSVALYVLVSAAPGKNYFVGLPFYLILWIFSWAALSLTLNVRLSRSRIMRWRMISIACVYLSIVVLGGLYALGNWPSEGQWVGPRNRMVTQQIAKDLRTFVGPNEAFIAGEAWGYPATLQYYMVDTEGRYPQYFWIDPLATPDQVMQQIQSARCKAILVYREDIEEVGQYRYVNPLVVPIIRAIAESVRLPESPYVLVRTYHIYLDPRLYVPWGIADTQHIKEFTLCLYVRKTSVEETPSCDLPYSSSQMNVEIHDIIRRGSLECAKSEIEVNSIALRHFMASLKWT